MSPWRPAHSPKEEGPTSREQVERKLLYAWKWRKALWRIGAFRAVDPMTPGQRERAALYLREKRRIAAIFLACRTARAKYPRAGLIMNNDPVEISPSAQIPPGVYRHVGGGVYRKDVTAGQGAALARDMVVVGTKLRLIPGGRS